MLDYRKEYEKWMAYEGLSEDLKAELVAIQDNDAEIEERFYQDLAFGTAGLRGKLGAGLNRMNVYVVGRATRALAEVILQHGEDKKERGVAIAYDCRIMSPEFANECAKIFAAYGIKSYLFDTLRPTPELSYAVRYYNCIAGINITASHNPKEYNGYKVYWEEGSQIKDKIADAVFAEIQKLDVFDVVEPVDFDQAVADGLIQIINEEVDEAYYKDVMGVSLNDEEVDKDIRIVYSPLNGAGNVPVRTILDRMGYKNVFVVKEQENPDGTFPTVAYPNPEDTRAFEYAIRLGKEVDADILIATDPDSDRLAVQVMENGENVAFNGNQIGVILIQYILENKAKRGELNNNPAIIKSIVTGNMGAAVAADYGVKVFNVLTGFKNIAELPNIWDETHEYEFIFGYEESIGYNAGNFVRDKDAVSSALLLAEAAGYYKKKGKNLREVLEDLFKKYGYYAEKTVSIGLEGIAGQERIGRMMKEIKMVYPKRIGDAAAKETVDYETSVVTDAVNHTTQKIDMEQTKAFEVRYEDGSWYTLRPSGTEPKIKLYIYTKADTREAAMEKVALIEKTVGEVLDSIE